MNKGQLSLAKIKDIFEESKIDINAAKEIFRQDFEKQIEESKNKELIQLSEMKPG